ncbi:uncharacterized protein LOC119613031 [Lucilia sericata]|uniref:uncharacterized protein LOC119613031 n=1 Tax=Lucilia sericata TaxID=13632 RepID=UPI0018A84B68|nr:uncharacterized protein LOC119613031 [Lucilia sericata]
MSTSRIKSTRSEFGDIQWNLMDGGAGKIGKASGMKIEYTMSDEIDFAQKLSIIMRKQLMRQLLLDENNMYQKELNSIGRLHSRDTVCEELRKCTIEQGMKQRKYINRAQVSHLGKLFKVFDD